MLYVSDFVELTRPDLEQIPDFGDKSVKRIIRKLGEHGLRIRDVPAARTDQPTLRSIASAASPKRSD